MKTVELDVVFLSYDEPNADLHYADLCNKVPWAKRVHGIKGSDSAHKEHKSMSKYVKLNQEENEYVNLLLFNAQKSETE